MKIHEMDEEARRLDTDRFKFAALGTYMTMKHAAAHREELSECKFIPVTDEIKQIFEQKEEAFMEMDPSPHVYDAFVRPLKKIKIDGKDVNIPKEYQAGPDGKPGLGELPADIIFANTIPVKHMSIMPRVYKTDKWIDFYIIHFHEDELRNSNIFKMLSGEEDEASIGWIEHIVDGEILSRKGWIKYYREIVLDSGKDTIALKNVTYFESSENLKQYLHTINSDPQLWYPSYWEETQVMFEVLAAWYTLQECILHDELRTFVKKAKVEKPSIRKPSKKGMHNKKYVQKYYIQLQQLFNEYDINNMDNNTDEDKYKKKKALWHVAGHWRHYKDGRRVFIQGYWKGTQRNSGTKYAPPVPIEISLDNFKSMLKPGE